MQGSMINQLDIFEHSIISRFLCFYPLCYIATILQPVSPTTDTFAWNIQNPISPELYTSSVSLPDTFYVKTSKYHFNNFEYFICILSLCYEEMLIKHFCWYDVHHNMGCGIWNRLLVIYTEYYVPKSYFYPIYVFQACS